MDTAQIAALLEPFLEQPLSPSQLDQISMYIDLLQRWNARINLTAIRNDEEIVTRHFGESFFLARHLFPASAAQRSSVARTLLSANAGSAQLLAIPQSPSPCHPDPELVEGEGPAGVPDSTGYWVPGTDHCTPRVLDIGSGAGFPALPLKLWAPRIHLTLIESNHKKAAFLREVARALTLTDIDVIAGRAEALAARPAVPQADAVTLRAVEHFETILPQAVTFLAPNATLALLIGAAQIPYLTTLSTLKWNQPIHIPQSHSRVLLLGYKA